MQRLRMRANTATKFECDPLEIIADRFKAETDVLCFDEFFVSVFVPYCAGSIKACSSRGITTVASNIPLRMNFYRNGPPRVRSAFF
ncbi:cell division protein ZapE [Escherichia coli]|nr:cell division protein ZapE [Escherichia coli]